MRKKFILQLGLSFLGVTVVLVITAWFIVNNGSGLRVLDRILSVIPPEQTFKKTCDEFNGNIFKWSEVKKLKGYCMQGDLGSVPCTEKMVQFSNSSVFLRSNSEIEGTWACYIENKEGIMKAKIVYLSL